MHTPNYRTPIANRSSVALTSAETFAGNDVTGVISEVVYSEDQPWMTQLVLLPLLQQLGQQSRWQLWLTPQQKLSRQWVQASGLPLTKVMQVSQLDPLFTVDAMVKALQTGNYSVVIGWLSEDMTDEEYFRLSNAAEKGNAIGFIMRPVRAPGSGCRPRTGLKIHSSLYH
ncbi:SOS-induced cell division inhibitor SulA [Dryocola sp. BD586]|jgi:cell division inhibitor SulA|uniref:SOS-induced cell division inhibitor SulA n=1 Tax=Dryocola sp. BD586 TaxID=3133271 RepID=UPI003F50357E